MRAIVDRCEGLLDDEADDERQAIEEAMVVLRRSRAQLDTSVPVRFLGVVGTPTPRLFPNVVRDHKHGDAS